MYYFLMHKDKICGTLTFDEMSGRVDSYKDNGEGFSPFLGNFDSVKMKKMVGDAFCSRFQNDDPESVKRFLMFEYRKLSCEKSRLEYD